MAEDRPFIDMMEMASPKARALSLTHLLGEMDDLRARLAAALAERDANERALRGASLESDERAAKWEAAELRAQAAEAERDAATRRADALAGELVALRTFVQAIADQEPKGHCQTMGLAGVWQCPACQARAALAHPSPVASAAADMLRAAVEWGRLASGEMSGAGEGVERQLGEAVARYLAAHSPETGEGGGA